MMRSTNKTVDIVYFEVTSGHRTAALAIAKAIHDHHEATDVRLVDLTVLLAAHGGLRRLSQLGIDLFNACAERELPLFPTTQIAFFQAVQRALAGSSLESVSRVWEDRRPDVVVSTIPICNLFLERALHRVLPTCPYVVVPVDLSEGRARYWFDAAADASYLLATDALRRQAAASGISNDRAISVSGMPVDPRFYAPLASSREALLKRHGLSPTQKTVLVTFGGRGSRNSERVARELCRLPEELNLIFLCGHNHRVRELIDALSTRPHKLALGFVEDPFTYYALSDVVVGKPGSMTITESIITQKPLVAIRSRFLSVVQRGNEDWLRETKVGEVVEIHEVGDAVKRALNSDIQGAALARHLHRGVYEIAEHVVALAHHGLRSTARP